ncbi:MAG: hypothetical protein JWP27_2625 [Flaviaesturariibacter sp.]|nr:hypothetical protein [Flaviaesturariibacter sp.]
MQQELRNLDLDVLNSMHRLAHYRLQATLRCAPDDRALAAQQEVLNELALAIDDKLRRQLLSPASHGTRMIYGNRMRA